MIETKFSLALDKNGIQRDVYAKQGEKHARTCQITLTVGGKVVPITGYALEMYFDDDPPTSLPITNNGNPISFEIPDGLCITPGERICELRISKDDTENIIYAPQFRVIIEGTLGSSGTPTPVGEVTLYQPLIGGLTTYSSTLDGDEYVPVYDPDLGESQKMLVTSFLDGKVDKVTGKGLSTNDFTDALKLKLDSVAQSDWNQSSSSAMDYIKNKPTIPSKTSDLTNDSGFITSASIPTKTSDLTNDSGFITEASIPTKTSDLTNDSGFITDVKDVNGNSLVSSGVATVPVVQIYESAGRTRYTAEEIFYMSNHGKVLLYSGFVVTNVSYIGYNKVRIFVGRPATYDVTYGYSVSFFCYNIENKTVSDQLFAGSTIDNNTLQKARNMTTISFLIVQTLPTQNIKTNIIYLVPSTDPQTRNTYDEFIYIESTSSWEQIGSTAVDLTGYATESWVQSQGYVTSAVTDVQDNEGTSLVTGGVATIPEIPEIPTDEEMATVLADLANFVTLSNIYVSSGGNILAD